MNISELSVWQVVVALLSLTVMALTALLFRPIAKKAGYSGWWSLIMLVPLLNVIFIWIFSFSKWPIEREQ